MLRGLPELLSRPGRTDPAQERQPRPDQRQFAQRQRVRLLQPKHFKRVGLPQTRQPNAQGKISI